MKELKVDLKPLLKKLEGFMQAGKVESTSLGSYRSVFKGEGSEFIGYKVYTPDDDASLIDWKASMKANKLLVKEFIEERNLDIFFLIDASSSMTLGSIDKLKCEYAIELVASLAYLMINAGDKVGLAIFTEGIVKRVPQERGVRQFYIIGKTLTEPKLYGGGYSLSNALKFVNASLRRRSLLIIVSDFIGPDKTWKKYLGISTKKFDVIGIMVKDVIDEILPEVGYVLISDPFSKKKHLVDFNLIKKKYEKQVKKEEEEIKQFFLNNNADFLKMTTNEPFVKPILELFTRRMRRWR